MDNLEVIRAKIKDDAVVLIDRIMRASHDNIGIILPKNSLIAASLNSLKNLKDEAESINKKLLIITSNEKIKAKAESFDIPVYDTLDEIKLTTSQVEVTEIIPIVKKHSIVSRMVDIIAPDFIAKADDDDEKVKDNEDKEEVDERLSLDNENLKNEYPNEEKINRKNGENDNLALNLIPPQKRNFDQDIENFYGTKSLSEQNVLKVKSISFFERFLKPSRLILLLIFLSILTAAASLYLVLPKATIILSTKTNVVNATIPVTVSKSTTSVDESAGILPGQVFSVSKTGTKNFIPSNNSEKTVSTYSHGIIHIYNAYSAAPQKLVASTRFETKDGQIFKIQKSIIVPGAKISGSKLIPNFIDTEVVASQPGEEYNIAPRYFTIPGFKDSPKYAGFYAKNTGSFIGGKIGKAKVLSREDFDLAKNELQDELANALKQETVGINQGNLKIIDGASNVKVAYLHSSAKVGDAVDSFTIDAKLDWQAVAFKQDDLTSVAVHFLSVKYPNINTDQIADNLTVSKPQVNWATGVMTFLASVNDNLTSSIDVNNLRNAIAGKNIDDIRKIIASQVQVQSATIGLWPFWVTSAPQNLNKINITVINENSH